MQSDDIVLIFLLEENPNLNDKMADLVHHKTSPS